MGFYISPIGNYYEGDRARAEDVPVTQRPTPAHSYSGGQWVEGAAIVPQIVTRAQFKLALLDLDLLDDVDALVAASTDRALQINWAERLEFERNHPLVIATAAALGKAPAEIDALFVLAASK